MIRAMLCNPPKRTSLAIIENDMPVDYDMLVQKTAAIQRELLMFDAEHVAVFLPNSSDYIAALCAALMCGKTVVPVHATLTSFEITHLLQRTSTHVIVTCTALGTVLQHTNTANAELLQDVHIVYADQCVMDKHNKTELITVEVGKDYPMILSSTSGSTGDSKIVTLSENNIIASLTGFMDKLQLKRCDQARFIVATPFTSIYGLMVISLCLVHGFPIIITPEPFTLNMFYRVVQEYQVTHYEGGTVLLLMMEQTAQRSIPYDISSLKKVGFGGSKVSQETILVLRKAFPTITFAQGYGMTEASPLISKNTSAAIEKTGSVGTAITGGEIAIDIAGSITKAPYTEGEIVVSGPNVMLGYYNNPEATSEIIRNGYLYTGDMGYLDEDGFLYICGRKKNIIIVRGHNVFPEEIESCLLNSLLVKDCVVYGQSEDLGDEIICADIIPAHFQVQVEDIQRYLTSHLANYKSPHRIQFVDHIKKVASGKNERKK
ncbi:long-chain-fatty-acid--CoA ligase [Paenibacillus silvae]|uniref:Long-chain-fatty-acid--CoA ligase n=1 Tax=Paenibacillus silvae TaxID=1325358 RepID=A0ABQ1Z7N5_9BACL|nr:class I adenylate-forming enzyme family protein [Paenibacillus silvae]GGH50210.1 long-chain-fatty-acid--CoA ligase [Paenibacillus silvae]